MATSGSGGSVSRSSDTDNSDSDSHYSKTKKLISVRNLFKFFCNNLDLGQFNLAKACFKELIAEKELLKSLDIDILQMLEELAGHPSYSFSR